MLVSQHVYLGIGGNLGNVVERIGDAIEQLLSHPGISSLRLSRLYRTKPVSPLPQEDFLNCVCHFQTTLPPFDLLKLLQSIESRLGKEPKPKEAPRPIDLDILFYGQKAIETPELQVPHPHWNKRLFVLIPLQELISVLVVPKSCREGTLEVFQLSQLIHQIKKDSSDMVLLPSDELPWQQIQKQ